VGTAITGEKAGMYVHTNAEAHLHLGHAVSEKPCRMDTE